jgi:hypothetical protein
MTRRFAAGSLALVLALALSGGCGDNVSSTVSGSMEEATVKGTVRVRGKPVNNGMITFRTSNINRPNAPLKEAKINKDGTYTITTLVGGNMVEVTCKEVLSARNRDLIENERMVQVQPGENTIDVDIPPAPPPAAPAKAPG